MINDKNVKLTVTILFLLGSLIFGETLFFSVSPFDTTYGLSLRYDFTFWKIKAEFYLPVNVQFNRGFPQFVFEPANLINEFHFSEYPYKVTYDSINDIPFTTFVNPAVKVWRSTWLGAGYYGDKLFYSSDFSILADSKNINLSYKILRLNIFVEKQEEDYTVGIGNIFYVFSGSKTGVGVNYVSENVLVYGTIHLKDGAFTSKFGLTLKGPDVEFNIVSDSIDSLDAISISIVWKVGEIYVIGRQQGQKVCLVAEFPLW
ncbi:MAG: hypothetical protein ACP5KD_04515 [Fervidobacterium sp.]